VEEKMKRMNMVEEQKSKLFFLGIFPKCPFYSSPIALLIILALIALGTWGIYYLNLWAAVAYLIYSLLFYFLAMPFTMCKYCYYKVKETAIDKEKGKTIEKLLS
jgi:membrane protein YdbS with pleckstrin-like domain